MEQHGNKTIMSSVMMLDIVGYSKKSVTDQISTKEAFNTMLAAAIKIVPENDRVILDTGDGAAVTFLGDIEDALKAVLVFRDSLLSEGASMNPPLEVCMGINLGPVRLVKDINGRTNIVGDGINVAQRIMGFAKGGQILVSRSYFDAASRLSHEYAGMFYNEGTRADKHGREHEIYAIGHPGEAAPEHEAGADTLGIARQGSVAAAETQGALGTLQNASGQQRALYAGIAVIALALVIVVAMKFMHKEEPAPQVATEAQTAPAETPAVADTVAAPPPAEETAVAANANNTAPETVAASPNTVEPVAAQKPKAARPAVAPAGQGKDSKQLASSRAQVDTTAKSAAPVPAPVPESKPAGPMVSVGLAIAPWGEVYLDGKKQGVSPPLDTLIVTPGEHAIEIRNTSFAPYTLSIQVKADEQIKIKHKFTN